MRIGVIGGYGHLGSILVDRINQPDCGCDTGIAIGTDDDPNVHSVDLWVLAVPPQDMESLLGGWCGEGTPIITFAAGCLFHITIPMAAPMLCEP